jgi:hypothetical protein
MRQMNFISEHLNNLTSGGKVYLAVQGLYIVLGTFFMHVQLKILRELQKRK